MSKQTRLLFCAWLGLFGALWVFASFPVDTDRGGFQFAGFPLRFATWQRGNLLQFDHSNLYADISAGLATCIGISWICVTSAAKQPITILPKRPQAAIAVAFAMLLFFAPVYFTLVDYNVGYLGRIAGLYPELDK
ncbi:MAG TPA: hypothetical protein VFE62_26350 [Gemmataceae bacterium]|nr:hypothetical protein [Gemmataceae bacterium]